MAIKFNHVTNTISFTSGACSASFVDSSATGIFETTGYARNCYITTGETGYFSPYNLDFDNFNVVYKCNSNSISGSTGSAILEGACNRIDSNLYSQINNGCCNCIAVSGSCHNYIENGFRNYIYNSTFSEILNGMCSVISGGANLSSIMNGSGNCIRGGTAMTIVNSMCSNICGGGTFGAVILGGCTNVINSASRSSIIGGNANIICSASVDAVINGGRSNCVIGASMSTIVGGNSNRMVHAGAIAQTGNVIVGGEQSRICGCGNTSYNTIINSFSGCVVSGSFNTLINGTCSCLINGTSGSLIIGARNTISGLTGAVIIGSGITANANNTLFVSNLCAFGSIAGTGNFVVASQTGCFITTGQTGAFALSANTGSFVTTSQTGTFLNTGLGYLDIKSITESIIVCSTGSTGLIHFNILSGSSIYNICNSTAKSYLNLRGNASCSLNSLIPVNRTLAISFLNTNGATAYELTGISIDGTGQTIRWMNGTGGAPSGNASAIDMYSIITVKTGNGLYNVFGSTSFLK